MNDPTQRVFINAVDVRRRFGISDMSLWRWVKDPAIGFPQPMRINNRRYFRIDEIEAFERRQLDGRAA